MSLAGEVRPVVVRDRLAWLHLPRGGGARGRAVVLCPTFGAEGLATHRGLYDLAERCAAAGMPALRLDFPGGEDPDAPRPDRLAACRRLIQDAADWLLRHAGASEVALCGLRLGALLAAQAAAERPGSCAALALLAPVASGRAYLRQLVLTADAAAQPAPGGDRLEAGGEIFHPVEREELSRADLLAAARAARPGRLLLLGGSPALAERLRGAAPLVALPFEGAARFFAMSHLSRLPCGDFARVAAWLAEGAPEPAAATAVPASAELEPVPGVVEGALRFGPDGGLVGVLCGPRQSRWRRTGVLLLNTGANPRDGVGRLGARLAYRLAALGIGSLRIDAAGVGDSDPLPGAVDPAAPPDMFDARTVRDAAAGLDALLGEGAARGISQVMVLGICAGADAAFRLALEDARVRGIALFNLPAFNRADGGAAALDGGPPPAERPLLRRPRMLLRRLRAKADMALAALSGRDPGLDPACGWMRRLTGRGTQVLLAYSQGDRGLRELRAHFGRGGRALAGVPQVRRVLLDGICHALTPRAMQDQALALVEQQVLALDGAAAAAPQPALRPAGEEGWLDVAAPTPSGSLPAA